MIKKKHSTSWLPTAVGVALVLAGTFVLPSCGGSGGSSPTTTSPTPQPTVRTVLLQTTFSGLEPYDPSEDIWFDFFTTSATGDIDITVDWTFTSNDVVVALARGSMQDALSPACQEGAPECPLELVAQSGLGIKPATLTIFGMAAGSYVVIVLNLGTTTESGVVVVGLTS